MSIKNASDFVRAYVEGYRGMPNSNPYPLHSVRWGHYEDHYAEGQADRRADK